MDQESYTNIKRAADDLEDAILNGFAEGPGPDERLRLMRASLENGVTE